MCMNWERRKQKNGWHEEEMLVGWVSWVLGFKCVLSFYFFLGACYVLWFKKKKIKWNSAFQQRLQIQQRDTHHFKLDEEGNNKNGKVLYKITNTPSHHGSMFQAPSLVCAINEHQQTQAYCRTKNTRKEDGGVKLCFLIKNFFVWLYYGKESRVGKWKQNKEIQRFILVPHHHGSYVHSLQLEEFNLLVII